MSIIKFKEAVRKGNINLANKCLNDENFPINEINLKYINGHTLLNTAILNNDTKMVKLLLNHKKIKNNIRVNIFSIYFDRPLEIAISNNNLENMLLLLEHPDIIILFDHDLSRWFNDTSNAKSYQEYVILKSLLSLVNLL
jgi:ankyrin repeat protein